MGFWIADFGIGIGIGIGILDCGFGIGKFGIRNRLISIIGGSDNLVILVRRIYNGPNLI